MCRTVTHSTEREGKKIFRKIKITPLSLIKGKMITIIDDYNYCHLITRRRRRRCPFGSPLSERAVAAVEDLAWIPRLLSIKTTRAADQCVCECVFVWVNVPIPFRLMTRWFSPASFVPFGRRRRLMFTARSGENTLRIRAARSGEERRGKIIRKSPSHRNSIASGSQSNCRNVMHLFSHPSSMLSVEDNNI